MWFWDGSGISWTTHNLHFAPDSQPHQHLISQFLQTGCSSWRPTNSVKAMEKNNNKQLQQPFNGRLSGTTRLGRYQKKHSPAHTHPGQRTSFIIFLHLQRSMASSLLEKKEDENQH